MKTFVVTCEKLFKWKTCGMRFQNLPDSVLLLNCAQRFLFLVDAVMYTEHETG